MGDNQPPIRRDDHSQRSTTAITVVAALLLLVVLVAGAGVFVGWLPIGMAWRGGQQAQRPPMPQGRPRSADEAGSKSQQSGANARSDQARSASESPDGIDASASSRPQASGRQSVEQTSPRPKPSSAQEPSEAPMQPGRSELQPGAAPETAQGDAAAGKTATTPGAAERSVGQSARKPQYLTALPPFEAVDVKAADESLFRPVEFSGKEYRHGIWAQPAEDRGTSQISFLLRGRFARMRGIAGICDRAADVDARQAKPAGTFRIYGDGNLLWESDLLVGCGANERFEIEVQGIELVALVVESDVPAEIARFAWGDIELVKE